MPIRRRPFTLLAFPALLLIATALTAAGVIAQPGKPAAPPPTTAPAAAPAVRLTLDYHDGVQKVFTNLAFSEGMTVLDALNLAKAHTHGITFTSAGSNETAFISQIDDLKNQGGGKTTLNWQYSVNGKVGDVGVGAAKLKAGDAVLWEYDVYRLPGTGGPAHPKP